MTDQSLIVKLSKSIEVHGEFTDELKMCEPLVDHLCKMDDAKGDMAKSVALIAAVSSVPPSTIRKLPASDLGKIMEVLSPFLIVSQETGKTALEA